MPGFPTSMPNRDTLEEFIVNFLWYNILHSTCNYALAPDFIPISPPKLYEADVDSNKDLPPNKVFMDGENATVSQVLFKGRDFFAETRFWPKNFLKKFCEKKNIPEKGKFVSVLKKNKN